MKSRSPMIVEVTRGQIIESSHQVIAVIMDERGLISGYWGNTDFVTIPRSCIKMLQAIPFVESGAMEKFGLDDKMLALACSSHQGEKAHILLAQQWMEKLKITEAALHCGPAMPSHAGTAAEMIKKGFHPTPTIHNCSGKHLGIISTCLALGENPAGYGKMDHPAQVRIRKYLSEVMKIQMDKMPFGVDGCGIPTYAVPLHHIATGMNHLMQQHAVQARRITVQRIVEACKRHPHLLSGTDDFVTAVNEKSNGRAILKNGAEGVYAGLIPDKGYSFALKVLDGHWRAAEVAAGFILRYFGGLTDKEYVELKQYTMPDVKNSRGERVGEIRIQKVTNA